MIVLVAMKRLVSAIAPGSMLCSAERKRRIAVGLSLRTDWRNDRLVQFFCSGNLLITGLGVHAPVLSPISEILPIHDRLIQSGRYRVSTLPT
jgi:hypothetical protein